ncbi:MAG: hypothetical protein E7558_06155 [Ruminococcaceae bacterium]|nr:hypothetical protein [Oscillospiraceae bacterium]
MKKTRTKILSFVLTAVLFSGLFTPYLKAEAASSSSKAGRISVSAGNLNVRKSASTGSTVLTSLKKDSYVTLISESGDWWKVEYGNDRYGYCHSDYIRTVSSKALTVNTNSNPLNVRSGAGTSYGIKTALPKGETVIELSRSGDWSRILYHGTKTGYVNNRYLSSSYKKISLKVPDFKQTDSRWADVKIGSSGKTIRQIGCATTGIAMMESYRTGKTIYPDAMSKKLSYSSSGNVYWPSDYKVVTSSSGYLSKIYDRLEQGKPVLFGAKNSSGTQHWVVITGFNGGSLSASGFTIKDPGSTKRVNLQQFLNAYPNFYKYFYY